MRTQRFRLLTESELDNLEAEFVKFLIVNGIDADSWQKMKTKTPDQADEIVGIFSDMVIENMLKDTQFLTIAIAQHLVCYHCQKDRILAVGVKSTDPNIDLSKDDFIQEMKATGLANLDVYYATKKLGKNREEEVFDLIKKGCQISDGTDYKDLSLIYARLKAEEDSSEQR